MASCYKCPGPQVFVFRNFLGNVVYFTWAWTSFFWVLSPNCILPTCKLNGRLSDMMWMDHHGVRLSAGTIQSDQVTSVTYGLNTCALSPVCDSINFRSANTTCQLVTHIDSMTKLVILSTNYSVFVHDRSNIVNKLNNTEITVRDFLFLFCKILLKSLIKWFLIKSNLGKVSSKHIFIFIEIVSKKYSEDTR